LTVQPKTTPEAVFIAVGTEDAKPLKRFDDRNGEEDMVPKPGFLPYTRIGLVCASSLFRML
jgi:hypothetical protein